ncbi:MAG: DUF4129 domain-containing protein [Chloroflexi bacterium]|nr:DUF4129 domain-containing protein [Chloroflexota bacterium]
MILRPSQDLLLPGLLVTGEITWLSLAFRVVATGPGEQPLLSFGLLLAVAAAGAVLMRWASRAVWPLRRLRLTAFGAGVSAALLVVTLQHGPSWPTTLGPFLRDPLFAWPPAIPALVMAGVSWWRGIAIGDRPIDTLEAEERFRAGALALVILAFVTPIAASVTRVTTVLADLPGSSLLFFTTGLTALAIARLRTLRLRGATGAGTAPRWLLTTLATIGLVLASGLTLIALLPGPLGGLGQLMRPLVPLLRLLDPIVLALILPLALALERLLLLISRLLSRFDLSLLFADLEPARPEEVEQRLRHATAIDLIALSEWLVVLAVVGVVAVVAWRAFRKRVRRREADPFEVRESVWSWRAFGRQLLGLLRGWLRRLRPQPMPLHPVASEPMSEEARSIRAIYRAFLAAGAANGVPRRPDQTPLEYLSQLALPPEPRAYAQTITAAYLQVRYGDHPPSETTVMATRQAWQALAAVWLPPTLTRSGGTSSGFGARPL